MPKHDRPVASLFAFLVREQRASRAGAVTESHTAKDGCLRNGTITFEDRRVIEVFNLFSSDCHLQ